MLKKKLTKGEKWTIGIAIISAIISLFALVISAYSIYQDSQNQKEIIDLQNKQALFDQSKSRFEQTNSNVVLSGKIIEEQYSQCKSSNKTELLKIIDKNREYFINASESLIKNNNTELANYYLDKIDFHIPCLTGITEEPRETERYNLKSSSTWIFSLIILIIILLILIIFNLNKKRKK